MQRCSQQNGNPESMYNCPSPLAFRHRFLRTYDDLTQRSINCTLLPAAASEAHVLHSYKKMRRESQREREREREGERGNQTEGECGREGRPGTLAALAAMQWQREDVRPNGVARADLGVEG